MTWRNALSLRRLLPLLVTVPLIAAAFLAHAQLGLEWSSDSVRALVAGFGPWGPAVFVLLVTLRMPLFLPSKLLLIAGGVCFGVLPGTLYGALGITFSGLLVFGLTRWLGMEVLRSQVPLRARLALAQAGSRTGAGLVGLGTGYPIGPLTAYHVGAALTGMPFAWFAAAVAAGAPVRAGVYCVLGDLLVTGGPVQTAVALGLLVLPAVPLLHPRLRAWLFAQLAPTSAPGTGLPPTET